MKNKLIGAIIFVLLCTTIIPNFIYATDIEYDINTQTMEDMDYSDSSFSKLKDDGKADISTNAGRKTREIRESFSLGAGLASAVGALIMGPVLMISALMTMTARGSDLFINSDGTAVTNHTLLDISTWGNILVNWYTIEDTVFGSLDLFNADYFTSNSEIKNDANKAIKNSVAAWYYTLSVLGVLINLLVLIYIGIKMAVSTVASAIAKYKEMLKDWLVGMVLIFALPYIIGFINLLCSGFVELLCVVKDNVINKRIRTKHLMASN